MPVISEHSMRDKKSLRMFQRYEVQMSVVGWDEKYFHMNHSFLVKDRVVAEGKSSGCVVSKQGVIPPDEVMNAVRERLASKS